MSKGNPNPAKAVVTGFITFGPAGIVIGPAIFGATRVLAHLFGPSQRTPTPVLLEQAGKERGIRRLGYLKAAWAQSVEEAKAGKPANLILRPTVSRSVLALDQRRPLNPGP